MTHAYDESYLKGAMRNVGIMAHYCINEYGVSPSQFYKAFLRSKVSKQIFRGNPRYLVGYSGKELADIVLADNKPACAVSQFYSITPEYWAGWILTYYQWYTGKRFSQIQSSGLTFCRVTKMYNPLHEADISKFIEVASTFESNLRKSGRFGDTL